MQILNYRAKKLAMCSESPINVEIRISELTNTLIECFLESKFLFNDILGVSLFIKRGKVEDAFKDLTAMENFVGIEYEVQFVNINIGNQSKI